jgi:prepilin-type N-terminal cleavage/methylation domain-containing protein/prepilin-type processing-associated H-X9-DG protein
VKTERTGSGFTLLELLVVISIISLLAGLLLPSLAKAKAQAQEQVCRNSTKQLAVACLMYAGDNKERLPYNFGAAAAETNVNWVAGLLDWEPTPDNTNTALLSGSALGSYVGGAAGVYRCPADTALASIQRLLGWPERVRSYSLNASIGDAGALTAMGYNVNNPGYAQFFTVPSIKAPSQIFMFLDEHPDSIYDGYFVNRAAAHEWVRLPGSYHDGGANFSFSDGHAELHRWQFASTKPPSAPDATGLPIQIPAGQGGDFQWIIAHMSVW